ncbi:MAG: UDP-N-acetylmuramate dehydrogenase [Lachnospiraceae bacterium]|nr:UDP-N-acetylmuramate dehydrogenase [Lachnospiraceae bacterium]
MKVSDIEFTSGLAQIVDAEDLEERVLLSTCTTFAVGGPARWFVSPKDEQTLIRVIELCEREDVPYFVLGYGSNLLVSDRGYKGVIIRLKKHFSDVRFDGTSVKAGGGASLKRLRTTAWENGYVGLAFAAGIPGSIGGAIYMNCGAYDKDIASVLSSVTVYQPEKHAVATLSAAELQFSYRRSILMDTHWIVLEACFDLLHSEDPAVLEAEKKQAEEYIQSRKQKQPLEYPSAGSTFKRPVGGYAGKLIMESGLAGFSIGDAAVSQKHCGFIVNRGHASADDIYRLCKAVQKIVKEKTGFVLEPEICFLGSFEE